MDDPVHVVCPHCDTINRVPSERLSDGGRCGNCHQALFDGHPAALVYDPGDPAEKPTYFVLLGWSGEQVLTIRDFRHARYAIEGAEITRA